MPSSRSPNTGKSPERQPRCLCAHHPLPRQHLLLLRVADGHPVEFDGIHELVTWNYATGELTRVAQVRVDFVVSLAPTLLD